MLLLKKYIYWKFKKIYWYSLLATGGGRTPYDRWLLSLGLVPFHLPSWCTKGPIELFQWENCLTLRLCHDKYQRESDTLLQCPLHSSFSTEIRYLALLSPFLCVPPPRLPSFPTVLYSHHFWISNLWPTLNILPAKPSTSPVFFLSDSVGMVPFVLGFIEELAIWLSIRRIFSYLYKLMAT